MNSGPITPNHTDADGFKEDETEAFHEMHETRMQLNAKASLVGYLLLLAGAVGFGLFLYFFG